ncbi:hypothetical protein GIS00_02940 [Nakamurella sp. YIM 132087]|uniref:Helicase-associated domain-containing protein n=1 Tax=Nakamurella alba TaxID=2665158 RepID=A0A7K1FFL9_9ACTN|nr:hypothetical protein [Nakamurella alba]MTD12902.1 hypothetical protein [Nakamurella alba]
MPLVDATSDPAEQESEIAWERNMLAVARFRSHHDGWPQTDGRTEPGERELAQWLAAQRLGLMTYELTLIHQQLLDQVVPGWRAHTDRAVPG